MCGGVACVWMCECVVRCDVCRCGVCECVARCSEYVDVMREWVVWCEVLICGYVVMCSCELWVVMWFIYLCYLK